LATTNARQASAVSWPAAFDHQGLVNWLREEDPACLAILWQMADQVRREHVGDEVHLRGLVEISNHCVRQCGYCGLRFDNQGLDRYRMEAEEILACAQQAAEFGYGTLVLQAGEDYGISREWLAGIVQRVKAETELAVTLSMGERSNEDLWAWREAGADRYLLRFETSDADLYARIHPPVSWRRSDRIAILAAIRELGYEVGSGIMIGIPGQTYRSIAGDLLKFRELDLDMIGVGPYLPHPDTPLGNGEWVVRASEFEQVPNTEDMTYKVIALSRVLCPEANIPSTTALATLNIESGRELGLMRGANVVMPNLTPPEYRVRYEIYPDKACIRESGPFCHACMLGRIEAIGRRVGQGQGGRRRGA